MSFSIARKISRFCRNNNIRRLNISSGEFICHPQWRQILTVLSEKMESVRIVSNGDWADTNTAREVLDFIGTHPQVNIALSCDRWHKNNNVSYAAELLKDEELPFRISTEAESSPESVVPVGRALGGYDSNFYNMIGQYCTKPNRKYEFLIDEEGSIYKCPYGLWKYARIHNFLSGGFDVRFKQFAAAFYSEAILNCARCARIYIQASAQKHP